MDIRRSWPGRTYYAFIRRWMLPWLRRTRLTPNQMTAVGAFLAALVPVGFYFSLWAGLVFLALSGMADTLDGFLAREQGLQGGSFGAFWDSTLDRISDCFFLLGFWVLFWTTLPERFWPSLLMFLALLGTGLVSYTKARIEGLGGECRVGLMDRLIRTGYFMLWAALALLFRAHLENVLWSGLIVYLALVGFTVAQRVRQAARAL